VNHSFGQTLSKTSILYENKNQIVLNNGKNYEKLIETPFYEVKDKSIKNYIEIEDHLFRLNRVFVLKTNNENIQLIEWVKEKMSFYKYHVLTDAQVGLTNGKRSRKKHVHQ